jgi:RNA ligase (TIGR02306 family)
MSEKLASVEIISSIYPHPNADKLELAKVLGYVCIVPKGIYNIGEKVILIQPDTVLPKVEWSEIYRKFSSNRVKAQKLRGEWSFGIVENLSLLGDDYQEVGEEVSAILGITKYELPIPIDLAVKSTQLPFGIPSTDEERYQNLDLLSLYGQSVDVTLKIDGQSFTAYYKDGNFGVCGRNLEYKLESYNNYTAHVERYDLESKLRDYCKKYGVNIALRGESYGVGIQSSKINPYAKKKDKGCAFFSVWLIDERKYARRNEKHNIRDLCAAMEISTVPYLQENIILTPELIQEYDEYLEDINGEAFEGVVIQCDNFSFKIINKKYDSKK